MLGICYGGQLMSHALGGSVERAHRTEIGWYDVSSDDAELAPPGPWFEYHVDKFTPPIGAQVFASTDAGPQAYRLGACWRCSSTLRSPPRSSADGGRTPLPTPLSTASTSRRCTEQSEELAEQNRQRCYALVDAFLDRSPFLTGVASAGRQRVTSRPMAIAECIETIPTDS